MTKGKLAEALAVVASEVDMDPLTDENPEIRVKAAEEILAKVFDYAGTDTCFVKAAWHEPLFILRAQDALAPTTVSMWVMLGRLVGVPQAKLEAAAAWPKKAIDWQIRNEKGKWPD